MRWTPGGVSGDIQDQRGRSGGGGFGGFGLGGGSIGCGGFVILLVLSLLFGKNFFTLLSPGAEQQQQAPVSSTGPVQESPAEHKSVEFVSFVLDDVQSTWDKLLPEQARTPYHHAKLILFRDATQSACGYAQAASGPFYCPEDEKVYVDLAFYDELKDRFGAPGDFAQAYVLAHEIGHHVQDILGTTTEVHNAMENDRGRANEYSVRLELQADCFAGVWGHSTSQRNILEAGDVEEGLNAAASVGDDRLQRMSGRRVNPDSFTHGSARDRETWFRRGFESGRISDCDTFGR
jgi:predicted metalloprotease